MHPVFAQPSAVVALSPRSKVCSQVSSTVSSKKISLQDLRRFLIKIGFLKASAEPLFKAKTKFLSLEALQKLDKIKALPLEIYIEGKPVLKTSQYSYVESQQTKLNGFKLYLRGTAAVSVVDPIDTVCSELLNFASMHSISPDEIAPYVEYLKSLAREYSYADVDYMLLAEKGKKIVPQQLLQTQCLQIKEQAIQAAVNHACKELLNFAKVHEISNEELAPYLKCLSNTDNLLFAEKPGHNPTLQVFFESLVSGVKEIVTLASYEKISKHGLKKTLPQSHPWYPPSTECLITTLGSKENRMDLSTGCMDKLELFSLDGFRIEFSSKKIAVSQSSHFGKACIDKALKIVRFEKWHEKDFRAALVAVRHLVSGHALIETELTLAEIIKKGYYGIKKDASRASEIANAVSKQLQSHNVQPESYLFNWLFQYKLAGLPLEPLKEALRPKFKDSPFIQAVLDPAVSFESFANGLFALIKLMEVYRDTSGKVEQETENFGTCTPMIKLVQNGRVFAFPLDFKPFAGVISADLFAFFLSLDNLEPIPDSCVESATVEEPILSSLLIHLAKQKNNTPLTQDFQELLKNTNVSILQQLMERLTPWVPPIQTPKELPADYAALITFLKSPYASLVTSQWEGLLKEAQNNKPLQLVIFSSLASTHPALAFEAIPKDSPEELSKTCQAIVETKKKLSPKGAFEWWLTVCRLFSFPDEEEITEKLLEPLLKNKDTFVSSFQKLFAAPRFGLTLIQRKVNEMLEAPLSLSTLTSLLSIRTFIPEKTFETVFEKLPESHFFEAIQLLHKEKWTTLQFPLAFWTSLFVKAKKGKAEPAATLILDIALTTPSCLTALKLNENSAAVYRNQVPAMGEWIYVLFKSNQEEEGKRGWKLYLECLDPVNQTQEARQMIKRLGVYHPELSYFCCGPLNLEEKDVLLDALLKEQRKKLTPLEVFEWWNSRQELPGETELPLTSITLKKIRREVEGLSTAKNAISDHAGRSLIKQAAEDKRYKDALKLYLSKFNTLFTDDAPFIIELLQKEFLESSPENLKPWLNDKALLNKLLAMEAFKSMAEKILSTLAAKEGFFEWMQVFSPIISRGAYRQALEKLVEGDFLPSSPQLAAKIATEFLEHQIYSSWPLLLRYLETASLTPALEKLWKQTAPTLLDLAAKTHTLRRSLLLFKSKIALPLTADLREKCLKEFEYELARPLGKEEKAQLITSYLTCIKEGQLPINEAQVDVFAALFPLSQTPELLIDAAKPLFAHFPLHPAFYHLVGLIKDDPVTSMLLLQSLLEGRGEHQAQVEEAYFLKKDLFKMWPVETRIQLSGLFTNEPYIQSFLEECLQSPKLSQTHLLLLAQQAERLKTCPPSCLKTLLNLSKNSQVVLRTLLPILFKWRGSNERVDSVLNNEMGKALLHFEQPLEVWEQAVPFLENVFDLSVEPELLLNRLLTAFANHPKPLIPYLDTIYILRSSLPFLEASLDARLLVWMFEYENKQSFLARLTLMRSFIDRKDLSPSHFSELTCAFFNFLNKQNAKGLPTHSAKFLEKFYNRLLQGSLNNQKAIIAFFGWLEGVQKQEDLGVGVELLQTFKTSLLPILFQRCPSLIENISRSVSDPPLLSQLLCLLASKEAQTYLEEQHRVSLQVKIWKRTPLLSSLSSADILEANIIFDLKYITLYGKFCTPAEDAEVWERLTPMLFGYFKLETRRFHFQKILLYALLARLGVDATQLVQQKTDKGEALVLTMSEIIQKRTNKQVAQNDRKLSGFISGLLTKLDVDGDPSSPSFSYLLMPLMDFFSTLYNSVTSSKEGIYFESFHLLMKVLQRLPVHPSHCAILHDGIDLGCQFLYEKWFKDPQALEIKTALFQLFGSYAQIEKHRDFVSRIFGIIVYQEIGGRPEMLDSLVKTPIDLYADLILAKRSHSIKEEAENFDKKVSLLLIDLFNAFVNQVDPSHSTFEYFINQCTHFLKAFANELKEDQSSHYLPILEKILYNCVATGHASTQEAKKLFNLCVKQGWFQGSSRRLLLVEYSLLFNTEQHLALSLAGEPPAQLYNALVQVVTKLLSFESSPPFLKAIELVKIFQETLLFNSTFSREEPLFHMLAHRLHSCNDAKEHDQTLRALMDCFEKDFKIGSEEVQNHVKNVRQSLAFLISRMSFMHLTKFDIHSDPIVFAGHFAFIKHCKEWGYFSLAEFENMRTEMLSGQNSSSLEEMITTRLIQLVVTQEYSESSLEKSMMLIILGFDTELFDEEKALDLIEKHFVYAIAVHHKAGHIAFDHIEIAIRGISKAAFASPHQLNEPIRLITRWRNLLKMEGFAPLGFVTFDNSPQFTNSQHSLASTNPH